MSDESTQNTAPEDSPSWTVGGAFRGAAEATYGSLIRVAKKPVIENADGTKTGYIVMPCRKAEETISNDLDGFARRLSESQGLSFAASRAYYMGVVSSLQGLEQTQGVTFDAKTMARMAEGDGLGKMFAQAWLKPLDKVTFACEMPAAAPTQNTAGQLTRKQ